MCQISSRSEYAFACYSNFCKCAKRRRRRKKRNFGHSYLGNGLSDFLQIWNVDSPSWRATLQQIWVQSDVVSPRYKCVKMTFSFFLSIYSRFGAPASWAARHTIVFLDLRNVITRFHCEVPMNLIRNYVTDIKMAAVVWGRS